jgi:Icc-related predicted phosphoesterase
MIKITHISDTHGYHSELNFTGGDILIHSGDIFDIQNELSEKEVLSWFKNLPYTYKILIPGNHDEKTQDIKSENNFFILNNEIVEISNLRIYGLSVCLIETMGRRIFNTFTESQIKNMLIDEPIDIFVTHGPPKGILDIKNNQSIGSTKLKEYVEFKKPKYHLFGHAHHSKGIYSNGGTVFVNNSIVNNTRLGNVVNKPIDIMIDND